MKREMVFLLILVLSGLVVAESSETSVSFNVGAVVDAGEDYTFSDFWDVYGGYVIALIVVLIIVIVYLKNKGSGVSRKRKVKRRVKRRK